MNTRKRLIFLTVAFFLGAGVIVLHRDSKTHSNHKYIQKTNTKTSDKRYHAYNLTYLDDLNDLRVKMNDPSLIAAIREKFLIPPLHRSVPYILKDPDLKDPSMGQDGAIRFILNNKRNGFFVEAGALDGETRSNTLFLERRLNWTGLLVEPDPSNFAQMLRKKRKAWLSPSCLSIHTYPHTVSFRQGFNIGKISTFPAGHRQIGFVDVQCLPLYSLLLALNRTTVDYLSLDVEGNELDVLRTIPFKDLNIRTLSVEYMHVQEGKNNLLKYMLNQGYALYGTIVRPDNLANDFVFLKLGAQVGD